MISVREYTLLESPSTCCRGNCEHNFPRYIHGTKEIRYGLLELGKIVCQYSDEVMMSPILLYLVL